MKTLTFVDLFAGIGGFHQALKELGLECVAACEIDKNARKTYLANHSIPEDKFFKDIIEVDIDSIPQHDILCAGFPCQPFSQAGNKNALNDDKSLVIPHLFKIIEKKKPKIVILENVKYIKYIEKGEVFNNILSSLELAGYKTSCKLLNAKDFGVAQSRERWIFVGVLSPKAFDFKYKKHQPIFLKDIIEEEIVSNYIPPEDFTLIETPKRQSSDLIFAGYLNKTIRVVRDRKINLSSSAIHRQPNRIYSVAGVHPTISSQIGPDRSLILLENGAVRGMTINECFRIMGYEDSFKKPVSKTNLSKQIGNSVCVPMIKTITKELIQNHL